MYIELHESQLNTDSLLHQKLCALGTDNLTDVGEREDSDDKISYGEMQTLHTRGQMHLNTESRRIAGEPECVDMYLSQVDRRRHT